MEHISKQNNLNDALSGCGNRIIHYCWFGGRPLSALAKKCIRSWKKYLPDFTIVQWNENNFDVGINRFCRQAYDSKKWAFAADVARCYALKTYGGLYFDTDMMVRADLSHVLSGSFAAGWESDFNVAAGVIWAREPENPIIAQLWDYYENNCFDEDNVYAFSIPTLLTGILQRSYGLRFFVPGIQRLRDDTLIFPREYFYPISSDGSGQDQFTANTCMVHYYLGSWLPRPDRLRASFRYRFGTRLGNALLDILVWGKHTLKGAARLLLHPLLVRRHKKAARAFDEKCMAAFDKEAAALSSPAYIALYNKNWYGPSIATKALFENTLGIEELHSEIITAHIADYLVNCGAELLLFSSFSVGWDALVKQIKEQKPELTVKVLWHGSFALNTEGYDWDMFSTVLSLYKSGHIQSLGFVKKSMAAFFRQKGYRAEFVANRVSIPDGFRESLPPRAEHSRIKIGLYASGDRWVKNFQNQLAAASLFENAELNCVPLSDKAVILSRFLDFDLSGSYTSLKREKLLRLLAENDINLYVTFTECAPLLPLESLELGVPCITGSNHHYWQGTALEKYLVVDRADDCMEIYRMAKAALENKDEILRLYRQWKKDYNEESILSVNRFLSV